MSTSYIGGEEDWTEFGHLQISNKGLQVLRLFLDQGGYHSGAEVSKTLGIGSGRLYPLLLRFETNGWMKSYWEEVDPSAVGRPRRRLYQLTALGQREANREFQQLKTPAVSSTAWGTA